MNLEKQKLKAGDLEDNLLRTKYHSYGNINQNASRSGTNFGKINSIFSRIPCQTRRNFRKIWKNLRRPTISVRKLFGIN